MYQPKLKLILIGPTKSVRSYIKVAVYVRPEYSGEKFALKLGQILSVHPQVTHPGPVTVF